eukprot:366531-Chlamydomonas_euryale.AAC.1
MESNLAEGAADTRKRLEVMERELTTALSVWVGGDGEGADDGEPAAGPAALSVWVGVMERELTTVNQQLDL